MAKFAKTFGGEKCKAFFADSRTFFCLNERGDQALSNGGKHNPCTMPRTLANRRWKLKFFLKITLTFENSASLKGLEAPVTEKDFASNQAKNYFSGQKPQLEVQRWTKKVFRSCLVNPLGFSGTKMAKFAKTFGGEKCEAFFAASRTFFCLKERGDQALSNGGKDNPVRCLERWQIAVENWKFFWK